MPPWGKKKGFKFNFRERLKKFVDICCSTRLAYSYIRITIAEFIGTTIFLFVGCIGTDIEDSPESKYTESIIFGLAMLLAVQLTIKFSGGHINPIITLSAAITNKIDLILVPAYLFGQFFGGIIGCLIFEGIHMIEFDFHSKTFRTFPEVPKLERNVCTATIPKGMHWREALILEAIQSGILSLAWNNLWDLRNRERIETAIFRYAVLYGILILSTSALMKCTLNPARSLAPAIINNKWKNQWVFLVGPSIGATIASLISRFLLNNL